MVNRVRRTNAQLAEVDAAIVEAVEADKPVTLRGVYYRVVSAGAVPKTEAGYTTVQRQLLKLRRSGRVSYWDITDGTRVRYKPDTWTGLDQMLDDAASSYRRALWHNQAVDVEIYSEKDAITGAVNPVTDKWDVYLGIVRGYSSETFAWRVAKGIQRSIRNDKFVYIYQLGDHDPSGVNAWYSFERRVREFLIEWGCNSFLGVTFERLAVTPEQIESMGLPTRPTKTTDTRAAGFAGESVEVDAIPARELRRIVEEAITQHIDQEALRLTELAEQSERDILLEMREGLPQF